MPSICHVLSRRLLLVSLAKFGLTAINSVGADIHTPHDISVYVKNGAQVRLDAHSIDGFSVSSGKLVDFMCA